MYLHTPLDLSPTEAEIFIHLSKDAFQMGQSGLSIFVEWMNVILPTMDKDEDTCSGESDSFEEKF